MIKLEDKIYMLGLKVLDELLLHRNISKHVEISIEDAGVLSDMIVHVDQNFIFPFSEKDIVEFYRKKDVVIPL